MKLEKIIEVLKQDYPPQLALSWDNPGLQVGRKDRNIEKVYVALDATDAVIHECISWGAELLVTHHPLIMSGIRSVSSEDYIGQKALAMAEHGIAHYAMHTNYDVTMMNEQAIAALRIEEPAILDITGTKEDGSPYGIGCVGKLPQKMTAQQCCDYVKKAFHLDTVRLFGNPAEEVEKIAVCPGSGKSELGAALASGAQIYVTGDIGHHEGLDANDQGMLVIDAGHYGIEHIFIHQMAEYLRTQFPQLQVRAAKISHPFSVF
jgi:dinuclear metal center YbgI/SA1388 family protein